MTAFAVFLLYMIGIAGAALLLRPVWRQWHLPMAVPLTLLIVFELLISIFNAILLAQSSFPSAADYCLVLSRRLLLFIPLLWFWLTYEYIRRVKLKPLYIVLMLIEPLYILLIFWRQWQPLIQGHIGPIPLAFFYFFYSYGFVLGSIFWLAWHVYRTTGQLWKMPVIVVFLSLFPLLTALYGAQILPYRLGPPMLLLILVPAVLHFRWLAIVPLAGDQLADYLSDGVLVLDAQNRIVDANPSAVALLAEAVSPQTRLPYPLPMPDYLHQAFDLDDTQKQQCELALTVVPQKILP